MISKKASTSSKHAAAAAKGRSSILATQKKKAKGHSLYLGNGLGGSSSLALAPKMKFRLDPKLLLETHDLMVKARVMEERLIRMYKQSDGYFWIGGPGEEAFNVPLGMNVLRGEGL